MRFVKPDPEKDGWTHINACSHSKSPLGKALSPFTEFEVEYEEGLRSLTLEGYYHYVKTGRKYPELLTMTGLQAKTFQLGKEVDRPANFFKLMYDAMQKRILADEPVLAKLISRPDVPVLHYYVYGKRVDDRTQKDAWLVQSIMDLRSRVIRSGAKVELVQKVTYPEGDSNER